MKATFRKVINKERKFGSALDYYALKAGSKKYLFTQDQLDVAEQRGKDNPEDFKTGVIDKILRK